MRNVVKNAETPSHGVGQSGSCLVGVRERRSMRKAAAVSLGAPELRGEPVYLLLLNYHLFRSRHYAYERGVASLAFHRLDRGISCIPQYCRAFVLRSVRPTYTSNTSGGYLLLLKGQFLHLGFWD